MSSSTSASHGFAGYDGGFTDPGGARPAADRKPAVGLRDDDRTSALLIPSGVDPNLAASVTAWVLSSNDPQPHDQAQRHSEGGQEGRMIGVVSCGWSLGWRHADRDQFGPRIRLR